LRCGWADRLGVDPTTASQTYYACLLTYSGCTADAEIAAELFGGGATTHVVPVMFGSQREMMAGVMRALPDPARAAPVRAAQIARRLPRAAMPGRTFEDAELAAIRQPTLHVHGTADPVGSAEIWKRVAGVLHRGELPLVEGAGHMPWFHDPSRVAAEVSHFLAQ
jgi:pimeloyl-ACP methyl ester carboxylesterase